MFGNLEWSTAAALWWLIVSLVGAFFVFLTFVQGGQTLLLTVAENDEKNLIVNSLGRKWELTFTTLVLFGGAFFAAFPLFYATSFGGAYWVWILNPLYLHHPGRQLRVPQEARQLSRAKRPMKSSCSSTAASACC